MRWRAFYLGFFVFHALLVLAVAGRELAWLVARGYTALPQPLPKLSALADACIYSAIGGNLAARNPARHLMRGYLHSAGIEAGYSYFAPNLSGSYKLLLEIELLDGRVEHHSVDRASSEGRIRLASFLDQAAKSPSPAMRDALIELFAARIWNERSDAVRVKAFLVAVNVPTPADYNAGKRASYELQHTVELSRPPET